jgi:hypothetical protein
MRRFRPALAQELRQAEVEHLHELPAREHDVGALDVAVDDAARVRVVEGVGHLHRDFERLRHVERAAADTRREQLALHVFHRDEDRLAVFDEVVGDGDVRRAQHRGRLRLAHEPLARFGIAVVGRGEELQRDLTAEPGVFGEEDLAHAARAEPAEHAVVQQLGADDGRAGGHRNDSTEMPGAGTVKFAPASKNERL